MRQRTLYSDPGINPRRRYKIINIYAAYIGVPQYIREILKVIRGEINNNKITVKTFDTLISSMDISSRQNINNKTQALNDTLDYVDLTDMYGLFYPTAEEYAFFSSAHGTFWRTDHMLGQKKSWYI